MLSSGDLLQVHGLKERHERMRLPMLQVILAKRTIVKLLHTVQLTGSSAWSSEAQSRYSSTVGQMVERYNFKNVKKYKTQGTSQKMLKTLSYDSGTPLLLTVLNERKVSKRQLRCPQQSWGQEIYFRKKNGKNMLASLGAHPCGRQTRKKWASLPRQRSLKGFDAYPYSQHP